MKFFDIYNQDKKLHPKILKEINVLFKKTDFILGNNVEKFDEYKEIQMSGMFNMFDQRAREMTNLTKAEWVTIMQEYEKLDEARSDKDET